MKLTRDEVIGRYPNVRFDGEFFFIREGAIIREGAYIREGADIGERAIILTKCSKYAGNIIPFANHVDIRLGCEVYDSETWKTDGAAIAAKHNESLWWQETGSRIIEFFCFEAELYSKKYHCQS